MSQIILKSIHEHKSSGPDKSGHAFLHACMHTYTDVALLHLSLPHCMWASHTYTNIH